MRPRQVDIERANVIIDPHHKGLYPITVLEPFAGDLLSREQDSILSIGFGSKMDYDNSSFIGMRIGLHDSRNDPAFVTGICIIGLAGFCFP